MEILDAKIKTYIQRRTNHREVISIEQEPPLIPPDTDDPPQWFKVIVKDYKGEQRTVFFSHNDGHLIYALKKDNKYIISDIKKLNQIF